MKKRLADVITAQVKKNNDAADSTKQEVVPIKPEQIRLWLAEDKDKLLQSFTNIA